MRILLLIFFLCLLPLRSFAAGTGPDGKPHLNCLTGPVTKTYSRTEWLVYSCDDDQSLIFVSAPGNPVEPLYFILIVKNGKHRLFINGTGDQTIIDAVTAELNALSGMGIVALVNETKHFTPERRER